MSTFIYYSNTRKELGCSTKTQAILKEDIKFSFLTSILTRQSISELNRFDNYLLRAYYVSAISVNASQDRKENPYAKTNGSVSGAMAETQAPETRFHVGSLLLIRRHTSLLYLNATFTSFRYLHCKHSRNSECTADTVSAC